jgi:hypothetical protein
MERANRWRDKARAYRDLGMGMADPALRRALFVAAEVYSSEAKRVSCCGTVADPPHCGAVAALLAGEARRVAEAVQEFFAEADEDQDADEWAPPESDSSGAARPELGAEWCGEAAWNGEEEQGTAMDACFVRQQAARYRRRAGEIADPVARLALRSLALTCDEIARDLEASAAQRGRGFRGRKGH